MIIYGTRGRESLIGSGQFFCPQCQSQQSFGHKRISRYFALYFIPLFPISTVGEYIECGTCRGEFSMEVLNISASDIMVHKVRAELDSGMPLHMVQQKLLSGGIAADQAKTYITQAAELPLGRCPKCNYYYRRTVQTCTGCGGGLTAYNG
jgi:hypothetical protein